MDDQVPFNSTFNGTFNSSSNSTNGTFEGFQPPSPPKSFWTNLLLPTLYLIIVIGSLYTFSNLYRKRQVAKTASLEPWFPAHRQRDIYFSLLHLDPAEAGGEDDEKKLKRVPDSILKAALMQRALEDIRRIVQLRTSKQALQTLLQRGSVGDELWQRFLRAEQEMEAEVKDVVNEANDFSPNWGQVIFQSANEMNQNIVIKQRIAELQEKLASDRAWWDKKKAGIQSDFLKEVGASESSESTTAATPAPAVLKPGSSDEEGVLVDSDVPTQAQGGANSKKKKGKK
ncbi:Translocation protein S66 [Recurvomyces mirabilis]|uniref:Translocation protein S66 n=1 Tax=Recurvomyces mirabilis TaxID=574656 RepID=A0AAE0WPU0_9PEZI|nr:Translocation protein S66 [Recurvomyces mirabilis]KAK5156027.1 Translocation protein S66 [Recurvomyces mirabilis]